jgi:NAD(P)-dependent dehydrogenase (short-subunit alcohol dehydrogenase family)
MSDLSGRVAFVTAGSRGIGRAISLKLAEAGADVGINYVANEEAAREIREEARAMGRRAEIYQADVSDWEACRRMVSDVTADLGPVDLLVNNAGLGGSTIGMPTLAEASIEQLHSVIDVTMWGPLQITKLFLDQLRRAERSDVIFISSIAAQSMNAGQVPYTMSKVAVEALSQVLAKEEHDSGMRVNVVAPGLIETDMGMDMVRQRPQALDTLKAFGDLIQPEDVADAVLFLVSPEAKYVSGQRISVAGAHGRRPSSPPQRN